MKTKLALILTLLCLSQARAHLIDLTPGGWSFDQPNPTALHTWFEQVFFDSAARGVFQLPGEQPRFFNEWISRFGALQGAEWFTTDIFEGDRAFSSISWDMTGEPHGFYVNMIYVVGQDNEGEIWQHIYSVSQDQHYMGEGIVTANRLATIQQIAFAGRIKAPDTGSTLGLFGLGMGALAFLRKYKE
jgi:hypothetical protein